MRSLAWSWALRAAAASGNGEEQHAPQYRRCMLLAAATRQSQAHLQAAALADNLEQRQQRAKRLIWCIASLLRFFSPSQPSLSLSSSQLSFSHICTQLVFLYAHPWMWPSYMGQV